MAKLQCHPSISQTHPIETRTHTEFEVFYTSPRVAFRPIPIFLGNENSDNGVQRRPGMQQLSPGALSLSRYHFGLEHP